MPPQLSTAATSGAALEQHVDGARQARARGEHERRIAIGSEGSVRVDAGIDQQTNGFGAAVDRREPERRRAGPVVDRRVGAGLEQHTRELDVVVLNGPMKRGGSVDLRFVDVDAAFERGPDGLAVATHCGIRDFTGRQLGRREGQQRHGRDPDDDRTHRLTPRVRTDRLEATGPGRAYYKREGS